MESENALALDYFKENQISFEWIVDEGGAVIRFAPIDIDKQQYASVYGENENISVEKIHLAVDFYRELMENISNKWREYVKYYRNQQL